MAGRKQTFRKEMTNILIGAAFGYGVLVGGMYLFQRSLLYHPGGPSGSPADAGVPEMTPVDLGTADGLTLTSWFRAADPGRPTIVFFQGNAGHIGNRGFKARGFLDAGYGLLLTGYRGYGGNPGSPTEEGLYADGRAALAFLADRGVAPGELILYGESLGTGIAVHLAAEMAADEPAGGLVLETPFSSIADVAASNYPFIPARWLVKDRFDSAAKIARVDAPVFIFHSRDDRVIPVRFGERLFEAAVEPKSSLWTDGGGHNALYEIGAGKAVLAFLDGISKRVEKPDVKR